MAILGISGSLRRDAYNTKLLQAAEDIFLAEGVELVIFDGLKAVPPYDEDDDHGNAPAGAQRLRAAIAEADGILFATPEYNSSIPGQLKNALDWASRPKGTGALANKPSAVVGASTGMFGAVWAQADLRKVLAASGARVVEGEVAIGHAQTRFEEDGSLNDPNLEEQLRGVVRALVAEVQPAAKVAA
jgi:chromate reductase